MPTSSLKPTPEAEAIYRRWLTHLNDDLGRHTSVDRRSEIVRDELFQMYLGRPHGGRQAASLVSELATAALAETFDPRNVTLAIEYDDDLDEAQFAERKPLIYFWRMFDRSPLGANEWLGMRFRCMLGRHIFRKVGKGVRIFGSVEFTRGYNLTIEDDCVIHAGAVLDDREELVLGAGTTVFPDRG